MRLEEFDYELPEDRIAQRPLERRDDSRLLRLVRPDVIEDRTFRELPDLLRANDLLVVNNSRVLPARLLGRRLGIRAQPLPGPRNPARRDFLSTEIEVLLLTEREPGVWDVLVRPGRKLPVGERLEFAPGFSAEIVDRGELGERRLRFTWEGDFTAFLDRYGHMPLPPYIRRPDEPADRERYQTVFARSPGSVAAPTAGLHFTPAILEALTARGIEIAEVSLHVGLGTFQPVHSPEIELHNMHAERFEVCTATADALNRARQQGRRIVAVGTTAARTLESIAPTEGEPFVPQQGKTHIFLHPGRPFRVVDALITNFHAPRSTLLMLVSALAGVDFVRTAYRHALDRGYRFLSYGDCTFIE